MQIEEGKYYRTRDGRKVGPLEKRMVNKAGPRSFFSYRGHHFDSSGMCSYRGSGCMPTPKHDIIAEWTDGPIRTVTRREVVPGTYGKLEIHDDASAILHDWTDPTELRAAARLFNEIAALYDEKEAA